MSVEKIYFQDVNRNSPTCGEILEETIESVCIPDCPPQEDLQEYKFPITFYGSNKLKGVNFIWDAGFEWGDYYKFYYGFDWEGTDVYELTLPRLGKSTFIQWFTEDRSIYFFASVMARNEDEAYNLFWNNYNTNFLRYVTYGEYCKEEDILPDWECVKWQYGEVVLYNGVRKEIEPGVTLNINADYFEFIDETNTFPMQQRDKYSSRPSIIVRCSVAGVFSSTNYLYQPSSFRTYRNIAGRDAVISLQISDIPVNSPLLADDWYNRLFSDKEFKITQDENGVKIILRYK